MGGVSVSYSGVHQAYQIALAADEAGLLDRFYCSIYRAPHCWGGRVASIVGQNRLASRRAEGLSASKVEEYPWPLFWHQVSNLFLADKSNDWLIANDRFDRHVAKRLENTQSKIFVGVETCAYHSLKTARRLNATTILDCPGVDTGFLDAKAAEAAAQFNLTTIAKSDSPRMSARKTRELALADIIVVCSKFQLRTMERHNIPADRACIIPLWIDHEFWLPPDAPKVASERLRVLFVGKISVRKGIPYLLEAARSCPTKVELTLVGDVNSDVAPLLRNPGRNIRVLSARPKIDLLRIYRAHDVFVLPSLGDSFGISALEAMLSGLAVIVTENCGVPVPNESWRVPVMNVDAIVERLQLYVRDRASCRKDGDLASEFAKQFTPTRYRANMQTFLQRLLG